MSQVYDPYKKNKTNARYLFKVLMNGTIFLGSISVIFVAIMWAISSSYSELWLIGFVSFILILILGTAVTTHPDDD